jgi:hypothetical protein
LVEILGHWGIPEQLPEKQRISYWTPEAVLERGLCTVFSDSITQSRQYHRISEDGRWGEII